MPPFQTIVALPPVMFIVAAPPPVVCVIAPPLTVKLPPTPLRRTASAPPVPLPLTVEKVLPVTMAALTPTLGSASAIGFVPDGWATEADRTYAVHFENGAASLDYVVEPTSCAP